MPSVQITAPDRIGTGAFITPTLVVTAAHVVHPRGRASAFSPDRVAIVLPDGSEFDAIELLCHGRWTNGFNPTADMALVRVKPRSSLVFPREMDVDADELAVEVLGFREGPRDGHVTRARVDTGNDTLESDDLTFHDGVSGAPIVDDDGNAIGIATRSADLPTADAFIGLPFLENNLGWLLTNLP